MLSIRLGFCWCLSGNDVWRRMCHLIASEYISVSTVSPWVWQEHESAWRTEPLLVSKKDYLFSRTRIISDSDRDIHKSETRRSMSKIWAFGTEGNKLSFRQMQVAARHFASCHRSLMHRDATDDPAWWENKGEAPQSHRLTSYGLYPLFLRKKTYWSRHPLQVSCILNQL